MSNVTLATAALPSPTTTPRAFALDFIRHWEDGGSTDPKRTHSLDPADNGNWTGARQGYGKLVGSHHGVTAAALALHRSIPVPSITREIMHALTIDEAADIALSLYYQAPGLDGLAWNRVTASVMDMGWGAGPTHGIQLLQRLIGAADDGAVVPDGETARRYPAWLVRRGEGAAAGDYAAERNAYYESVIARNPMMAKNRNGWRARSAYYTPGDRGGWWTRWSGQAS